MSEEELIQNINEILADPFYYFRQDLGKDTIQIYALSLQRLISFIYE